MAQNEKPGWSELMDAYKVAIVPLINELPQPTQDVWGDWTWEDHWILSKYDWLALYFPDSGWLRQDPDRATLHRTRPDGRRPMPPAGLHRAACGQILWPTSTRHRPDPAERARAASCRVCFPG